MAPAKAERNRRMRDARLSGASLSRLAREAGVSKTRVIELLRDTGGDPLRLISVQRETEDQLRRRKARLIERMAADWRVLIAIEEELEARETDRILGVG